MGFYLSVALKNVFRQKKRSFTLGINYAVVTFILVLLFAFSQGASRNITTNLVRSTAGHITVSGSYTASAAGSTRACAATPRSPRRPRRCSATHVTVIPRYVVRSTLYYNGISKRLEFTGIDTGAGLGHPGTAALPEGQLGRVPVRRQRGGHPEGRGGRISASPSTTRS